MQLVADGFVRPIEAKLRPFTDAALHQSGLDGQPLARQFMEPGSQLTNEVRCFFCVFSDLNGLYRSKESPVHGAGKKPGIVSDEFFFSLGKPAGAFKLPKGSQHEQWRRAVVVEKGVNRQLGGL